MNFEIIKTNSRKVILGTLLLFVLDYSLLFFLVCSNCMVGILSFQKGNDLKNTAKCLSSWERMRLWVSGKKGWFATMSLQRSGSWLVTTAP